MTPSAPYCTKALVTPAAPAVAWTSSGVVVVSSRSQALSTAPPDVVEVKASRANQNGRNSLLVGGGTQKPSTEVVPTHSVQPGRVVTDVEPSVRSVVPVPP